MNGRGEVPGGPNAMTRREARVKDGFCESKNHLSCGIEPPKRPQSASWFCRVEGAAVVSVSRGKDVLLMSGRIRRQPEKQEKQKTARKQDARVERVQHTRDTLDRRGDLENGKLQSRWCGGRGC